MQPEEQDQERHADYGQVIGALLQPIEPGPSDWPETFVHFTTSQALWQIVKGNALLFSECSASNDDDEVWGGIEIIQENLRQFERFQSWRGRVESEWPEFMKAFSDYLDENVWVHLHDLYLFCMCAANPHHPMGKLSMWRAYGDDGRGVAIGIRTAPMKTHRATATLPIQLHRTRYENADRFCHTLMDISDAFWRHAEFARALADKEGIRAACWLLFYAWFVAMATRKHPGFSEEEEWRFLYLPHWDGERILTPNIEPAPVGPQLRNRFKLEIQDYAQHGMAGTSLNDILDYVVVGPATRDKLSAQKAVTTLLDAHGVEGARNRVRACDTPYRSIR